MTPSSFDSLALSKSVQIDAQLRAYLIKTGRSVNAVSFDDVVSISAAIAARRRQPSLAIATESVGTLDAYRRFRDLVAEAAAQVDKDRPWFHPDAASMVCRALIEARLKGSRVRLFYGDSSTGDLVLSVANDWWMPSDKGARRQALAIEGLAKLAALPLVRSVNLPALTRQ